MPSGRRRCVRQVDEVAKVGDEHGHVTVSPDDNDVRRGASDTSIDLDEALSVLGALEDARDALIDSGHLAVVVNIETEIRALSRKLGFDDPAGGTDGR